MKMKNMCRPRETRQQFVNARGRYAARALMVLALRQAGWSYGHIREALQELTLTEETVRKLEARGRRLLRQGSKAQPTQPTRPQAGYALAGMYSRGYASHTPGGLP